MSWRVVVISSIAKLDLKLGNMVVRAEKTNKIHLAEINTLIIENTAVSLTSALLSELTNRKIKVIFCDAKRNPHAELLPYYGSHDTSAKIRLQCAWKQEAKDSIWTEIVHNKIHQQAEHLAKLKKEEAYLLTSYLNELEYCDSTNREGHAAKVYFNALFGQAFTRSNDCLLNAALNYGYAILLSAFNREIVANGYITQLGIHHDNMFNQFNLASDFMEPFRPLIDTIVYEFMCRLEHEENIEESIADRLGKSEKHLLVNVLNQSIFIDNQVHYVNNAIKIYCKSLFDALNENNASKIKFYKATKGNTVLNHQE